MIRYQAGILGWNELRFLLSRLLVLLGDMAVVFIAYSAAFALRFYYAPFTTLFPITKGIPSTFDYLSAAPLILAVWALSIMWNGCYHRVNMSALDEWVRFLRASIAGTVLSMSAMFLYRESSFSRLVFVMGGAISFASIYVHRELIKSLYIYWVRRNRRPHRVLIIGSGYLSTSLKKILERHGDRAVLRKNVYDLPSLQRTIRRSRIKEVLVAHPTIDHAEAVKLATFCEESGISCRLLPDILEIRMGEVLIDDSLGIPTFRLKPISLHGSAFLTKRVIDVTIAGVILGIFSVPLLTIALLIKLTSKGPVFHRQARMGFRGRTFQFLKFRTMVQNADQLLGALKAKSDRGGPVFKMKNDPRVTPIGRFLRRYSIDEIPQLINVLKGEMSLVGPRPQVLWEAQNYDEWAKKRLNVLPGITGLWQVSGRAELTYEEMIELDIFYIEHWSPGLDIKIILKTLPAILMAEGAY